MNDPTRAEKLYWNRLATEVGCICCHVNGTFNDHVSIHHIGGRAKPGAHKNVLPLCYEHHQGGNELHPSIHPWKARFEAKYGTQEYLKKLADGILGEPLE